MTRVDFTFISVGDIADEGPPSAGIRRKGVPVEDGVGGRPATGLERTGVVVETTSITFFGVSIDFLGAARETPGREGVVRGGVGRKAFSTSETVAASPEKHFSLTNDKRPIFFGVVAATAPVNGFTPTITGDSGRNVKSASGNTKLSFRRRMGAAVIVPSRVSLGGEDPGRFKDGRSREPGVLRFESPSRKVASASGKKNPRDAARGREPPNEDRNFETGVLFKIAASSLDRFPIKSAT